MLSAATIALALLADATGVGPQTTTLGLVLLPVVLFLGIAAHGRLVEINREEVELSLAMNRLRHAYLKIAPALKAVAVVAGAVTFLVVWAALFLLQRRALDPLRRTRRGSPRHQTKPERLAGLSASLQPMERSRPS